MGLFGDKAPTAKFNRIGDRCGGVIVDIGESHRTEYLRGGAAGEPMYWSSGRPVAGAAIDPASGAANRPVMDAVVTVETGVADEYGETERRIFVKGKADLAAVKDACVAAGVRDIEIGGRLTKTWVSGAGGTDDPRVYAYEYTKPGAAADQLQEVTARKDASAAAAAERLTTKKPTPDRRATAKEALGVWADDEPPF